MIKKIVNIKHVSKFVNYAASGDLELRHVNLLQADNGRGKTTIADILRSLQTGDPSYIKGRSSLGLAGDPQIAIRLETETRTFKGGKWDQPYPLISIFDETFVHDNVYTGVSVEHEHRRNLYRLIVGAKGVALARHVDELDDAIRETNKVISARQATVKAYVPSGLAMEVFLSLPEDANVNEKIAAKEAELRGAQRAAEIAAKPAPSSVLLPPVPASIDSTLSRQLTDIQPDLEYLVRQHISAHEGSGIEAWLSRGMAFGKGPGCPFCGQDLSGSKLIGALRSYFSQAYSELKQEIGKLRAGINESFGDAAALRVEQQIATNSALVEFWREFVPEADGLPLPAIHPSMAPVKVAALACLDKKAAAPLDVVLSSPELGGALAGFTDLIDTISAYNARITMLNAQIQAAKAAVLAADAHSLQDELVHLRAVKLRHIDVAKNACADYIAAAKTKADLDSEKTKAKRDLDDYTKAVFSQYQGRLNALLGQFGADFRIGDVKTRYAGGGPSSTFHILVNDVPVELGDSSTPRSTPSFRNTLSAGDRRALALAFFLAQLEDDADLAAKTVVFDDPFTSLDKARRTCTQQNICALAASVKQVIVLSHDPHFLRIIYDALPAASIKALHLVRVGQSTTISEWNIEEETREDYFQNYDVLQQYISTGVGEPMHVVRSMRPVLEKYLRVKFPHEFGKNEWLGDFIGKIRVSEPGDVLAAAQPVLSDLEAVNDYSKRFHHDGDQPAAPDPIVDAELQTYARRTVSVIREAWLCPAKDAIQCWAGTA